MEIAAVDHDGEPGAWLSRPLAACVLRDLAEFEPTRQRVRLLEQSLTLAIAESDDRAEANRGLELAIADLEIAYQGEKQLRLDAEKRGEKIRRRGKLAGALAGTAGAGIGALITALVLSFR